MNETLRINRIPWRFQIVEGRVFELRSKSKRYPAPCALVIDESAHGNSRMSAPLDRLRVIGRSYPCGNPDIYVERLRRELFNSSHILCRRDLAAL
jgi:hypothetical protein